MDFSRLEELSKVLNSKSDILNEAIKAFEARLASLRLGIDAWVSSPLRTELVQPGTHDEDEITTTLGYAKNTGAWCLTVMEHSARYDNCEGAPWPSFTSLSQAPREIRIKAIKQLPQLIEEIEKRATEAVKVVVEVETIMRDINIK